MTCTDHDPRTGDGRETALIGNAGRRGTARASRRGVLLGVGATVAGAAAAEVLGQGPAAAAPSRTDPAGSDVPAVRVGPDDPRYQTLSTGFNQRFVGTPAYVAVVTTPEQCRRAVQAAIDQGRRITVRGGGHCYEGFVSDNPGGVIIDVSGMRAVTQRRDGAVGLQGGCTNWDVYEVLYKSYGVTIPGGSCDSVGLGGHVVGGGYGLLSREHGLTVDYLDAVDVIVVDRAGRAQVVTARRGDPRTGDLFWAHTGGGGGTFGVITAYWFRDLPAPPQNVQIANTTWPWSRLDAQSFATLVRNFGRWLVTNSAPDSPARRLFGVLRLSHVAAGAVTMTTQVSGSDGALLASFLAALDAGMPAAARPTTSVRVMPWLQATKTLSFSGPYQRGKYKSAYMRQPFPDRQVAAIHAALNDPGYSNPQALLQVDTYGCRVNAVAPDATAVPQRSSIMKLQYQTYWIDPAEDATHLAWIRNFYRSVYADTGGQPVPNQVTDGCYVNYPDVDLTDWEHLYFKQGYPRLQAVKARWDPQNRFRHAQSVRPPSR